MCLTLVTGVRDNQQPDDLEAGEGEYVTPIPHLVNDVCPQCDTVDVEAYFTSSKSTELILDNSRNL